MSERRRSLFVLLVVLALIGASIAVVATKRTVLGLDLQGGSQLVYKAEPTAQQPTIEELLQRLEQQEQAIKVLERRLELKEETDATAVKSNAVVKASEKGFSIQSADNRNNIKLRGVLHVDGRALQSDDDTIVDDQFLLRRVRPIFEGAVWKNFEYRLMLDFASSVTGSSASLQDGYLNVHYWDEAQLQLGKFKEPVGLERLQSGANLLFIELFQQSSRHERNGNGPHVFDFIARQRQTLPIDAAEDNDLGILLGNETAERAAIGGLRDHFLADHDRGRGKLLLD